MSPTDLPSGVDEPPDNEAYTRYVAELSERLRHVCGDLAEPAFTKLVQDIARMRLRFEVLEDLPNGLRPLRDPRERSTSLPSDPDTK